MLIFKSSGNQPVGVPLAHHQWPASFGSQCLRESALTAQLPPFLGQTESRYGTFPRCFILVVEDEALLQEAVCATLVDAGFEVVKSSNGEDAIRMLDAPDAAFLAPLTDVNLAPGKLTGWDVARRARHLNPDLPVVYMTGAGGQEWSSQGVPNSMLLANPSPMRKS